MLPLLLMLVADPLSSSTSPPMPPAAAPTVRMIDAEGTMRAVNPSVDAVQAQCRNGEYQRADNGTVVVRRTTRGRPSTPVERGTATLASSDLMFRQGDPVQMTLLLERRVGQCSVPISYDVTTPDGRLPSFPARSQ